MQHSKTTRKLDGLIESGTDLNKIRDIATSRLTTTMNSFGLSQRYNSPSMSMDSKDKNYLYRSIYVNPEKELKKKIDGMKINNSLVISKTSKLSRDVNISNNNEVNLFLKTVIKQKKENLESTKIVSDEIKTNIVDMKLLFQLEKELDYYKNLNLKIQGELLMLSTRKSQAEISENEVQEYCKELKKKYNIIVEQIEKYDAIIKDLQDKKEDIIAKGDLTLEKLAENKMNLLEDKENLETKISYQEDVVRELEIKLQKCIDEKIIQKQTFDTKNDKDIEEYEKLNYKYLDLKDKMKTYTNEEAMEEYEEMLINRALLSMDNEKEEYNM